MGKKGEKGKKEGRAKWEGGRKQKIPQILLNNKNFLLETKF